MKLVEIAPALRTSHATIDACVAFAKKLGKTPVVVADSTGYVVNRLLVPYMVDAIALPRARPRLDRATSTPR